MPKKLIVCTDGTWNSEDGAGAVTNVAKLHRLLQNNFVERVNQMTCYVSGVGTETGTKIRGGAFGAGLDANIREAYSFLVDHYEPGDQLFFFGFSRGAYTARSLAGFIRNSGLLKREFVGQLGNAFALYRDRTPTKTPTSPEAVVFREKYAYSPDIECIGVWDTVGSLGIPVSRLKLFTWFGRWVDHKYQFHDTALSRTVKHAFHAISIHEHRGTFPATLWQQQPNAGDQVLEQVWFPGVHCDVGGGYGAAGLSDAALDWMIEKAKGCGLLFRDEAIKPGIAMAPDPLGKLHDSYSWLFRLIDWMNFRFGGTPRIFSKDANSCENLSNIAQDRYRLKSGEFWPPSFLAELQGGTIREEAKVHDIDP